MKRKTRADSNSGAERLGGSTPPTSTCTCGKEVAILKTQECNTCYHRRYYHEVRRQKIFDYLGGACIVCGSREDLEVDHIDPSEKSFEISRNLTFNAKLRAELDKCQLLCSDHHIAKTTADRAPFTHGTIYGFMKQKCKCHLCDTKRQDWHAARNESRRGESKSARGVYGRPSSHGDKLHYTRGCRCDLCRAANTAHAKELRLKKKS